MPGESLMARSKAWSDVPALRRKTMAAIRGKNTKPEMVVRSLLHSLGYRFRLHRKDIPGRPDLAFPARRKVVEVRGCFWHQHPGCPRARLPSTRQDYWHPKLAANVARDERNEATLAGLGWSTLVVWECEMAPLEAMASRLSDFLGPAGSAAIPDSP